MKTFKLKKNEIGTKSNSADKGLCEFKDAWWKSYSRVQQSVVSPMAK